MNNNIMTVKAEKREDFGSKYSRKLRAEGLIPAKIDKSDNSNIIIEENLFTSLLHKRQLISHIFDIEINGVVERVVLKDYQTDPVNGKIINVDFIKIHKNERIKLKVPLFYINKGKATAIKKGAFLNVSKFYIFIEYMGEDIIPYFIIDLDGADVSREFRTGDLAIPQNARFVRQNELLANFRGKRGQVLK